MLGRLATNPEVILNVCWMTRLITQLIQRGKRLKARGEVRKQAEVGRKWVDWCQQKETSEHIGQFDPHR